MANYDDLRAEREFRKNPPEFAPGQGDDGIDWDSFEIGSSSAEGDSLSPYNGSAGDDIQAILNNQVGNLGGTETVQQPSPFNDPSKDTFDKILYVLWQIVKRIFTFFKLFFTSLSNNTSGDWHELGQRMAMVSMGAFGTAVLLGLIGFFYKPMGPRAGNLLDASLLSVCISVVILMAFKADGRKQTVVEEPFSPLDEDDEGIVFEPEQEQEIDLADVFEESGNGEDEEDLWASFNSDSGSEENEVEEGISPEEALEKLSNLPEGIYTREYLYSMFMTQLPKMTPNFKKMESVVDGSDEFMKFYKMVQDAAYQTGVKDDSKLPEVTAVEKNLFIIQVTCTRPSGIKEQEIADLVADTFKRDEYGRVDPDLESVYAKVDSRVGAFVINLFLPSKVMVSLADVYSQPEVKEFLLNEKTKMPIIWGINEYGRVFFYDGLKSGNGDMIISGEKRSGKSWKGQSIIAQMAMFMSPKEVEFYFYDSKGVTSDYLYLSKVIPHARGFTSDPLKFYSNIKAVTDREIARREKILGGQYTNVKDYNKDHPLDKLSTVYIVIDEIASAREAMRQYDKELDDNFVSILKVLATKCPNLEIKLIVFPHRIVNEMIPKSVSSMISTRMQMGNLGFEELKTSLDIKNRNEFPYNLVKEGDMAFKTKDINNGRVIFCHAEVLTDGEDTNRRFFDFIGKVWGKLMPECKLRTEEPEVKTSRKPKDTSFKSNGFESSQSVFEELDETPIPDVDESFWEKEFGGGNIEDNGMNISGDGRDDTDSLW